MYVCNVCMYVMYAFTYEKRVTILLLVQDAVAFQKRVHCVASHFSLLFYF